ncbi:MAG: M56 family metallopeptidase, partial [Oscillospiraceae bacterium]|nr:M56 family metallopeptidase [Oscillospiraceae bacterium]
MTETVISSSVLILVVILLRTVFKGKIKNSVRYALWLIAAVRLLMPFGLAESSVSVMNFFGRLEASEILEASDDAAEIYDMPPAGNVNDYGNVSDENSGTPNNDFYAADSYADEWEVRRNGYTQRGISAPETAAVKSSPKKLSALDIARIVRRSVTALMLLWFVIVNIVFYKSLRRSRKRLEHNAPLKIYVCEKLGSPCIFGIVKPSVYVTEEAAREKRALDFAVAHELCHYYHGDILWTVLRYVLLSVYWFDPLVWVAALLSKRDCECACDEAVILKFGEDRRFEYGKAVVDMIPEKRSGLPGVASTSMSSGVRVLRARIRFISRVPKNIAAAVICTAVVTAIAAGCTFTSASAAQIYEDTENTEDTEPPSDVAAENAVSDLKGSDDFYVKVRDHSGAEKILFYMVSPERGGEAFVYMDKVSDNPYGEIGYIPDVSENAPARTAAAMDYYGEKLAEFIDRSRFSAADISCASGSDVIVRHIKKSRSESDFNNVRDALAAIEPVPADESMISEDVCAEVVFFRENGGFSSKLTVSFHPCGDRIAGQVTVGDYSDIISLITAEKQPPDAAELEKAYSSSCLAVSEWFYADGTELYKMCLNQAAGYNAGAASENRTYESFDTDIFSVDIAAKLDITGEIPENYIEKAIGSIIVGIPAEGNSSVIGSLLLWQDNSMTFKLGMGSEADFSEAADGTIGTFGGNRCAYLNDGSKIKLVFEDGNGDIYTAVFDGNNAENYEDTAKKILGSIHMKKTETAPYVPPVRISDLPSQYGDENYGLADTDYFYDSVFRANAPAVIVTGFRLKDTSREYETNFDCYIEKLEPDGKWYRVIPLGELVQANSSYRHFYTEGETARIPVCIDLSCYPLLPAGEYRLVKPFREAGADSDEYAALFDFTMSGSMKPQNELLCTAECTEKTVSKNAESISCRVNSSKIIFVMSEIADIEKETSGGWISVRKTPIHTNT